MTADLPARLLDVTRLVSRIGRGPLTGIDRVERAYLRRFEADAAPLLLLLGTDFGQAILPRDAASMILNWLDLPGDLPAAGLLRRVGRRATGRVLAEAALRPVALTRVRNASLAAALRRTMPLGGQAFSTGHSNLSEVVLSQVASVPGVTVSVLIHDTIPLDHPSLSAPGAPDRFRAKLAAVSRHAHRIIAPSVSAAAGIHRACAMLGRQPPVLAAPLGLDLAQPSTGPLSVPDGSARPVFLALGTIEPRKNHALLLDVWHELARRLAPDAMPDLVIAGRRGWRNDAVFHRLDSRPPQVHEAPGLSDAAVTALLSRATALLMPSLAEGFGLPVAEALASGCRVVASDLSVYRELHGNSPVYADPHDVYLWADKIQELVAGRGQRATGSVTTTGLTWDNHFKTVLSRTG